MINSNLSIQNNSVDVSKTNSKITKPVQQVDNKKTVEVPKDDKKLYYAVGGVLVGAGTAGVIALCSAGKNKKAITKLQEEAVGLKSKIGELTEQVADEIAQKAKFQKDIDAQKAASKEELEAQKALTQKLQAQLDDLFASNPGISTKNLDDAAEKYRKIAQESKLEYDPMSPPKNGQELTKKPDQKYIDFVKIGEPQVDVSRNFPTKSFVDKIQNLQAGESFAVPLQSSHKVKVKKSPTAQLSSDDFSKLEKWENSDMLVTAGETAKWSKEKIARDLLQNFYDGHGQTLDGVQFVVTKTNAGYKVRIAGQSTFDANKITLIGNTTKRDNPYEAGGFGEGLKMVNASMFGNHLTDNVRYGSADWVYDIAPGNKGVIQRKLSKANYFDGNFVEFETSDKEFLKKLVDATNYFEHSQNTDFQNVIYKNKDMGINFLGKDQKGNFYLTQRFAYGKEDGWEQNLDGLTLFFRRKPKIAIETGRDRRFVSSDDLEKVIRSFVGDISEEDALQMIMKMQSVWKYEQNGDKKAYKILLEALCNKFWCSGGKKIDLTQQKFAACNFSQLNNSRLIERLTEYGYTPCEDYFEHIGMPTAQEVLSQFSAHKPLQPTSTEIKKIKLLSEATKLIADEYSSNTRIVDELSKAYEHAKEVENSVCKSWQKLTVNILEDMPEPPALEGMMRPKKGAFMKKWEADIKPYGEVEKAPEELQHKIYSDWKQVFDAFVDDCVKNIKSYSVEQQDGIINLLKYLSKKEYLTRSFKGLVDGNSSKVIIKADNPTCPIHIFDRHAEKCENTLAEAMIDHSQDKYMGHWVSRDHLEKASFSELMATWLHEMCHQYAGDGDAAFGYKLTDLLGDTFKINPEKRMKLAAIKKAFDELNVQ